MADTRKVKIEIVNPVPEFIDLFEATIPTEGIRCFYKSSKKTFLRDEVFFLDIDYDDRLQPDFRIDYRYASTRDAAYDKLVALVNRVAQ